MFNDILSVYVALSTWHTQWADSAVTIEYKTVGITQLRELHKNKLTSGDRIQVI